MSWVRLDDQFADHPKVVGLSSDAFRLHVSAMCYCAKGNNRHMPWHQVAWIARDYSTRKALSIAMELCEAGFWQRQDDTGGLAFILLPDCLHEFAQDRDYSYLQYRDVVFSRNNNMCVKCATDNDLTIDHIVPVSRGGTNDLWNLQTLCRSCNSKKGARLE